MAATSSEAASKAHDTSLLLALIQQYCTKFDEDSLPIWDRLKQFPQFSHEAECHIEGAMQDPAEPPSAADAEPPEAPDAEPPLLADLGQEFLEAPEAPEAPEAAVLKMAQRREAAVLKMAQRRECVCPCEEFSSDDEQVDGIWRFKCACTKCGLEGRGCNITINGKAIAWIMRKRGKAPDPHEVSNQPGFCSDCRDHNLLDLQIKDELDVLRARIKRARVAGHVPEMCQEYADRLTRELEAGHKSEGSHIDGERLATMCE